MASRIWEIVEASKIRKGDVLSWHYMPHTDGITDDSFRVRVTEVSEREAPESEPLPYLTISVAGPTGQFERLSGVTTGRMYRQGDKVRRMRPAHAVMVTDANLRTRLDRRPGPNGPTDTEVDRLEERQLHLYRQILEQDRDESRDATDPIEEYVEVADVLAPVYRSRKRAGVGA